MFDSDLTLSTLPAVFDYCKSRCCPPKPEMEITMNKMILRPDSNGYSHICDHAGLVCDTADIARRWLVAAIQDGGHHFRFRYHHLEFRFSANLGQRRQSHIRVRHGRKYGGRDLNRGAITHRSNVVSTSGLVSSS